MKTAIPPVYGAYPHTGGILMLIFDQRTGA